MYRFFLTLLFLLISSNAFCADVFDITGVGYYFKTSTDTSIASQSLMGSCDAYTYENKIYLLSPTLDPGFDDNYSRSFDLTNAIITRPESEEYGFTRYKNNNFPQETYCATGICKVISGTEEFTINRPAAVGAPTIYSLKLTYNFKEKGVKVTETYEGFCYERPKLVTEVNK